MSNIPRRTIDELKFVYEKHPGCRDIFVEGPFDVAVVAWFLKAHSVYSVCIYEIGTVEIPYGYILATNRKAGNRERVIVLAEMLGSSFSKQAICLVDADFSYISGKFEEFPALLYTDYTCMEMYFFRTDVIEKFIIICCRHPEWSVETILFGMVDVLQKLFLFRFANEDLGWEMDWLDRVSCLSIEGNLIVLDEEEFILRFLNKNARAMNRNMFEERVNSLRIHLLDDARYQMHGHDFISVLSWNIKQRGVTGDRAKPQNILINLALSVDYKELSREPMFTALLDRLQKE